MPSSFPTHKISWSIITYFLGFFLQDYGQHLHQIFETGACSSTIFLHSPLPTSFIFPCSSDTLKPSLLITAVKLWMGLKDQRVPPPRPKLLVKNKSTKRISNKQRHTVKMRGWWQWMGKVPVQATKRWSHTFTHRHTRISRWFLQLSSLTSFHTQTLSVSPLFFQHSALLSHYLLVKPMPELGKETKRHWEDYYWKDLCSHHM